MGCRGRTLEEISLISLGRAGVSDILFRRRGPSFIPQLRQLLASIPALIERRFCVLSGHPFPLSDPVMTSTLKLLGHSKNVERDDRILVHHFRFLYDISHQPLVLLDLAHRLELMSRAWPTYNFATTNCELFSRSLVCCFEEEHKFCFAGQGYMQVPVLCSGSKNPIETRAALTAIRIIFWSAACVPVIFLGLLVMILVAGTGLLDQPQARQIMVALGIAIVVIVMPVLLWLLAIDRVARLRDCFGDHLCSELADSDTPPSSWTNEARARNQLTANMIDDRRLLSKSIEIPGGINYPLINSHVGRKRANSVH